VENGQQADPTDGQITGIAALAGVVIDTIRAIRPYRQARDKRMLPPA
jgi:hypothetical protein